MCSNKELVNNIAGALTGGTKEDLNENFYAEETLAPSEIEVTVKEVGKLSLPLSKAYIQKLINVSTTAKFGMGEETVLDKNIRDTQMIVSECLNVTINEESLSRIISNMQVALGFPADSTLTPHLYNMLIYGPGQFFNQHRDSEKLPNMVATLVIILPSPHIGGDLNIMHGKKKHVFSSENIDEENAKCVCFYSDCLHSIDKIKCGYRVALTFNVVVETVELLDTACTNEELKAAIRDYFNTAVVKARSKKVVFFLNHTYSKHSLLWHLLKGEDCEYASSLRSVARELELDVHLTLAEIHQNWSSACEDEAEPDVLYDTDTTLNYWVDANNVKLPYGQYSCMEDEICFTRETHYDNFDPTEEDFSGPTGNEGCTVDYWYKRAAIVLWQKSDSLMVKFEPNYDEAMSELLTLISVPENEKKVMEILDKAAELLHKGGPKTDTFETFVNIALYVKAQKKAQAILSPYDLKVLIPKNVQKLIQLQLLYGIDWLIELLDGLRREKSYSFFSDATMASDVINLFVRVFLNAGGDRSVMEFLLKAEITTFIEKSGRFYRGKAVLERSRELFKACKAIESSALQEKLAQFLISEPKLFPKTELIQLYHQLQNTLSPEIDEFLRAQLEESLKQELLFQTPDMGDWSISTVLPCKCEHCSILTSFLRSKTNTSKSWPANGNIRKHITSILKRSKAPVNVTIDCNRKPYSMVLVKSPTLHADAVRKCTELKAMLQTLEPKSAAKKRQSLMENDDEKRQKI